MMTHWLLAVGFAGMAVAIFFLGWSARIMRVEWRDDKALRAAEARYERHTHRKGDRPALPVAGRLQQEQIDEREMTRRAMSGDPALAPLLAELERGWEREDRPQPPWLFAGESEQGWASESAEYELLTQTAEQPASVTGEPPIDTGELLAITDRVESWIAGWAAQGNYDRHTMRAD